MTKLSNEFQNDLEYSVYSGNLLQFKKKWVNIIQRLENEQDSRVQLFTTNTIFDQ